MAGAKQTRILRPRHEVQHDLAAVALDWLQTASMARLIVDSERRVLWRNAAAERLLIDCPDLDSRNGHLCAEDRASAAALVEHIAAAGLELTTLIIPCQNGDGHIVFQTRRLPGADGLAPISVILQRTGSTCRVQYADFSEAFGLTAAEHQVVQMMIEGYNAEGIAARNGSSVGTVRSHIRSVYVKMDVSSREGLFFRLRPFRIL